MMTWNSVYFSNPSSLNMEMIQMINDFVSMMLICVLLVVVSAMTYFNLNKYFNTMFMSNNNLENIWTIMPALILIFIVFPSLHYLQLMESCQFCGEFIKITGHQWYWSYETKHFSFDSYMSTNNSMLNFLEVDNNMVVPSNIFIRAIVTSADVIHSWTIPSLGVKMDAIPGRMNQLCFSSSKVGLHFGQCSEICGANHSLMPIVMEFLPFYNYYNNFNL